MRKHGDVVLVTDAGVKTIRTYSDVPQIEPDGMGVGRARDLGIKYGLKHGYDCLIFSDSHMIIPPDIERLCSYKIAQPAVAAVDVKRGKVLRSGEVIGDFLGEYDWYWYYIFQSQTKKDIMSTQPMFSFSRDVAEALVSYNNGWFTQCLYWGKENFDPTLSASRIGVDLDLVDVRVGHVYKEGSPKGWRKRFVLQNIDKREPWYGKVTPKSPYMFGITFADAVFALKHYEDDMHMIQRGIDPTALKVAKETDWIMKSIKEFNKNARPRHESYERLQSYLQGASYMKVQ
ncbi:MAG: glycosyltransferase family A protein [Zestosphaera sp.]